MTEDPQPNLEPTTDKHQLPNMIPLPQLAIATKVRWNTASGDWGIVLGMRYVWCKDIRNWQYQYYIALDHNSPSHQWTKFDWGWQEDLVAIALDPQLDNYTQEEE